MKLVIVPFVLLAACATAGVPLPEGSSTHGVSLDLRPRPDDGESATRWYPTLISEPRVPTADRMQVALRAESHARLTADVRLCISPDGHVAEVRIARSSGVPAFDGALTTDLARWRYAPYRAPGEIRVCRRYDLTYLPR